MKVFRCALALPLCAALMVLLVLLPLFFALDAAKQPAMLDKVISQSGALDKIGGLGETTRLILSRGEVTRALADYFAAGIDACANGHKIPGARKTNLDAAFRSASKLIVSSERAKEIDVRAAARELEGLSGYLQSERSCAELLDELGLDPAMETYIRLAFGALPRALTAALILAVGALLYLVFRSRAALIAAGLSALAAGAILALIPALIPMPDFAFHYAFLWNAILARVQTASWIIFGAAGAILLGYLYGDPDFRESTM